MGCNCEIQTQGCQRTIENYCRNCVSTGAQRKPFCIALVNDDRCLTPFVNFSSEEEMLDCIEHLVREGIGNAIMEWDAERGGYRRQRLM